MKNKLQPTTNPRSDARSQFHNKQGETFMKNSFKKALAAVLIAACGASAQTTTINDVPYIDENGTTQTANNVTVINSNAYNITLTGWYLMRGKFTNSYTITVSGTVHLILEDGSDVTVTGSSKNAGIKVSEGNSLSIYAQSTGSNMGKLTANGNSSGASGSGGGAGIGGVGDNYCNGGNGGKITISGGTVTATGGRSAGIGGGECGDGGEITISGGTVMATGGYGAAGIGGGGTNGGNGGKITINGGTVTATSGSDGAGIGGGYCHNGGEITISGGTVTTIGKGAGIGGGSCGTSGNTGGSGGKITISDGTVTATSSYYGAGIGGGGSYSSASEITISGGTVIATGGMGPGIGRGSGCGSGDSKIAISGGTVIATGSSGEVGIGGCSQYSSIEITISGGTVTATGGSDNESGGAGIGNGSTFTLGGNAVAFASSVSDKEESRKTGGILFVGKSGKVYGNVELQGDMKIESGYTLAIPTQAKLTIPGNITLANNGRVTVCGTLVGTITGNQPEKTCPGEGDSSSSTEPSSSSSDDNTPIPIRQPQIATGNIRIYTTANAIVLQNLTPNAKVEVYNLHGKRIYSAYPVNPLILRILVQTKGMYVVKAGSQTMRVVIH